jgi:hypothetical protein
MKPEIWGPAIWNLFHTLAEKINESDYDKIGIELYNYIKQICYYLPCPDCSQHAKRFLSGVKIENISTKEGLKKLLYIFHNVVNSRKKKNLYSFENLENYKSKNIIQIFNKFIHCYKSSTGNMKLITDSFQRQMILTNFKKWFLTNYKSFMN